MGSGETTGITTVDIKTSDWQRESDSYFQAPANTVIVGREHQGDENGRTRYSYASVQQGGKACTVTGVEWSEEIRESAGTAFVAPANTVIVGREHRGDENANTRYGYGVLCDPDGNSLKVTHGEWTAAVRESDHSVQAPPNHILVGREHEGDEQGWTKYLFGTVE